MFLEAETFAESRRCAGQTTPAAGMPVVTIFAIPKPFVGHIGVIQRNAIESWRRIRPRAEIILFGDERGIREAARECEAQWIGNVARNEFGTPRLDWVFSKARELASSEILCYVNGDIILPSDFANTIARVGFPIFLMAGRRWDVDIEERLDFEKADWEGLLAEHGRLHGPGGIDYFIFPRRSCLWRLPPFAVGRPGWDNWMIYRARSLRMPVVDATAAVRAIHQNHGYGHVSGATGDKWNGPEGERNKRLGEAFLTLEHATHFLDRRSIRRSYSMESLQRSCELVPILYPELRWACRRAGFIKRWVFGIFQH
jgi:hypothetical protein